jgi:septal ring factor EnvC (AmiA/AmiB activator)
MRLLLCLIPLLAASVAAAETCKYVDQEGRITYSNAPIKGARKLSCFQPPQAPASAPTPTPGEPSARAQQPRVDNNTQRSRDDERRRILESELAAEQEQLAQAQAALAEQESIRQGDERNYARVQERLKPFQDTVAQHEKNVASIKQELSNLR